jgi:antitoxin StbD
MSKLVAVGEARARLSQLARDVGDQHIVLMNNCRPAAILVSPQRYSALVEEIEDLRDRLHGRGQAQLPAWDPRKRCRRRRRTRGPS